jgi:hypothetical protein
MVLIWSTLSFIPATVSGDSAPGHIVWVSMNGIPMMNADGSLRGYQGNDTDITERKHAEARVRAALAEKEVLPSSPFRRARLLIRPTSPS